MRSTAFLFSLIAASASLVEATDAAKTTVNKCWESSKAASSCGSKATAQCLCGDATYRATLSQCINSQASEADLKAAVAHAADICKAFPAPKGPIKAAAHATTSARHSATHSAGYTNTRARPYPTQAPAYGGNPGGDQGGSAGGDQGGEQPPAYYEPAPQQPAPVYNQPAPQQPAPQQPAPQQPAPVYNQPAPGNNQPAPPIYPIPVPTPKKLSSTVRARPTGANGAGPAPPKYQTGTWTTIPSYPTKGADAPNLWSLVPKTYPEPTKAPQQYPPHY